MKEQEQRVAGFWRLQEGIVGCNGVSSRGESGEIREKKENEC